MISGLFFIDAAVIYCIFVVVFALVLSLVANENWNMGFTLELLTPDTCRKLSY
jgi:hypothetical protein